MTPPPSTTSLLCLAEQREPPLLEKEEVGEEKAARRTGEVVGGGPIMRWRGASNQPCRRPTPPTSPHPGSCRLPLFAITVRPQRCYCALPVSLSSAAPCAWPAMRARLPQACARVTVECMHEDRHCSFVPPTALLCFAPTKYIHTNKVRIAYMCPKNVHTCILRYLEALGPPHRRGLPTHDATPRRHCAPGTVTCTLCTSTFPQAMLGLVQSPSASAKGHATSCETLLRARSASDNRAAVAQATRALLVEASSTEYPNPTSYLLAVCCI